MGLLSPRDKVVPFNRRAKHARHPRWRAAVDDIDARVAEVERRLAAFDQRFAALTLRTRFQWFLAISAVVHAFLILAVGFSMPDPASLRNMEQPLEVVLVNAKSATRPVKADALAQRNLDGGGNTDAPRRAKTPLPASNDDRAAMELTAAQQRLQQLEQEAKQVLTRQKADVTAPTVVAKPQTQAESQTGPNAVELMQRSLEIARLEASLSKEWDAYQQRPRRKFVGARTQEFRFARYIEDWRNKIERVGEVNYPQAARDQRISGSMIVTVSIRADGSLEKFEINRSSKQPVLDEAARRIVQLAAPFAPFPADIAKDTDVLSITRTWTFTRADQFVTE